jgi:hypothetical protein
MSGRGGLSPDLSFNAAYRGEVYAQPLLWRDPKSGAGELIVVTEDDGLTRSTRRPAPKSGFGRTASRHARPRAPGSAAAVSGRSATPRAPVIDKAGATLYLDAIDARQPSAARGLRACARRWIRLAVDVATALDGSFDSMVQNRAGGSSFPMPASPAIAAPITGWSSVFGLQGPARS